VKDNGKAKVELVGAHPGNQLERSQNDLFHQTQKDLPVQFLNTSHPVDVEIVIGSFGPIQAYRNVAFHLSIDRDPKKPLPPAQAERYKQLPEIHHIFKTDPRSPPAIITLVFLLMVLCTIPILAASVGSALTRPLSLTYPS
jgi:oligosaccharyltransferase complex subunit delta (ribophorin II)